MTENERLARALIMGQNILMATSKANAKKLSRTVLALSTAGTKYQFLTRPGMNNWLSKIELPKKDAYLAKKPSL